MSEVNPLFQTKGIRDGILITCGQHPWLELRNALLDQIKSQPSFFYSAKLSLDVGNLDLRVAELSSLRDQLSEYGINLWAVVSTSPLTQSTSQNLGLATRVTSNRGSTNQPASQDMPTDAAKWVIGPLRSGVKVTHQGNIVILGDVNPGAEIIAGGNVIVWGRLRGVVHAGVEGDDKTVVCALDMTPTQLRIADKIAISPKKKKTSEPEIARLVDGKIIAESWQSDRTIK